MSALARAADLEVGHALVEKIVLLQSQLSPRGARYTELVAAPLASPR